MTVSTTTNKVSFSANGSTTVFAYNFKIFADADLTVIIRAADGTETTKTLTTHYTVSGAGTASGGNVTFTSGNTPADGETVVIARQLTKTQGTDYVANDPFPAESHEDALDRLTFITQELQEELDRSIKASVTNTISSTDFTTSATDRASKVFAFDTSGNLSVTQEIGVFKGNWAASTSYQQRDLVKDTGTGNIFIVNTAHTSSGSQPLTTNTNSAKYDLIVDAESATTSASTASTQATAAASSATAAANSATAAASSATSASSSSSTATTKASESTTSADNSAASATAASNSATAAANSAAAAASSAASADIVSASSGGTFSGNVAVNARLDVDNIRLDANKISSTDTNGNITIEPDGTGTLQIESVLDINGFELILDGDADTSIHSSVDDQIDVKIAGSDDFRFTANTFEVLSGSSLLVNGTLDINGTELVLDADGDSSIHCSTDDLIDFRAGGADRFTLNGIGGFNIGNASYPFASASTPRGSIAFDLSGDVMLYVINTASSSPFGMIIDFANASPDNNTQYFFRCQDSTTDRFKVHSDGDVVNHDNSYGAISDASLKQDITPSGSQWDDVKALGALVKKYRMKSDVEANPEAGQMLGLVAQEVLDISPGLVRENNDETGLNSHYSLQYSVLYMKAFKALAEAIERIESLENTMLATQSELKRLEEGADGW